MKPSFWKSPDITCLPIPVRLHFIGLWNYADDKGRGLDDAKIIKGELWPADDSVTFKKVGDMQAELGRRGRIVRYTDGGRSYFEIVNWELHQRVDKVQPSNLPGPDHPSVHPVDSPRVRSLFENEPGTFPESSSLDRKGKDRKGVVGSRERHPDAGRLCELLADLVAENGSKRPTVTARWIDEADKLLRLDMRPVAEVEALIRWSQVDPFWRSNVLSMVKFRVKYDTLRLQRERPSPNGRADTPAPAAWDRTAG